MSDTSAPPAAEATDVVAPPEDAPVEPELVLEDLIVEDVSIDGMCGVY